MSEGVKLFQIEIRVRNVGAAMVFYRETFAWGVYQSAPNYALIDSGLMPIASLLQDPRLPLGVCPMVVVDDCTAYVNKAADLGGRVLITRSEVEGSGAFTGFLDPWGNEIFFWEPATDKRPSPAREPVNPFVFLEIATPNLPKAMDYYKELMGWEFWATTHTPNYAVVEGGGLKHGIGLMGGDASASGTLCYIQVASLEETQAKIESNGGQTVVAPAAFPGGGRYLIFSDVSGNRLGLLEPR